MIKNQGGFLTNLDINTNHSFLASTGVELIKAIKLIESFSGGFIQEIASRRLRITTPLTFGGPNAGKYGPDITPYLDTFHAVLDMRNVCLQR